MMAEANSEAGRPAAGEAEGPIDTSRMNEEQRAAMEVAEGARESSAATGLARDLLLGRFEPRHALPFPEQGPADKAVADGLLRDVEACLREQLDPEAVDETRTIPQAVIDRFFELGVFAMKVPQVYGGLGLSQVNYNRVMMLIASYCGSTAVLVSAHQSIGVPQPLKLFGTAEQKRRYFPRFCKDAISAFALTEPEVGSDPARMSTRAELSPDGKHYVLNGEKLWCTNGPIADVIVVMAQTAPRVVKGRERKQITAFIVERAWPGVEVAHRCDFMGIRGIQNGLMRFRDVRVPVENLLWGEGRGLKLALATLNTGRLTLPAACTGAAKQCLGIVRRWGGQRRQWGAAVGEHEAGAVKVAYIAATTFAMEAVTWLTSHWADDPERDIRIEAAMAKLFCSEASWTVVDQTLQLRGGRGYEKAASLRARGEDAYPVERLMRELRINRIIEGTSEIMRLVLAREALDPHLRMAAPLLRRGAPLGEKARSALGLLRWYAGWYPGLLWRAVWPGDMRAFGPLRGHARYVGRTAPRVARALFHRMAAHGAALEKRQCTLARLMEAGTELFAMVATCGYALRVAQDPARADGAIALADTFCRQARLRVAGHLRALRRNSDSADRRMAARVLAGDLRWLEDGTIWTGPLD